MTEIVAIAAATKYPRVLATSKGLTVSCMQEEPEKYVKRVQAAMKKTRVGRSWVQIPVLAKFSLAKSPLNDTFFFIIVRININSFVSCII